MIESSMNLSVPCSFDLVGDIALLHNMPPGDEREHQRIEELIMKKNKAIKVSLFVKEQKQQSVILIHVHNCIRWQLCVAHKSNLEGTERAPGSSGLVIIASIDHSPLIMMHTEYGTRCAVDLNHTFFSPRMGPE